ncbi:ABC transporter permease [Leucobacter luti]|uniref:Peptide/nickel transport system permease protein n=1 Tax=Leucobacter luti TaxID=340320 RepID=A0A4R6RXG4_9MICO|nr:ABC transporter permease [Leucobacter luti]MCW2288429.1 peptide/nickel transport system permease protein [Leucobacter luti]QYM75634.1 ABC transporter permease [Leucobacter luti]TCK45414.1 peptide/nickel transport system permease protein [Leucobacter luti]TDP91683.1 peptide/nickel transport system permease protein [Leucobacter luti]
MKVRIVRAVLGRLGAALLVVWVTATIVFVALRATGDPLEAILGGPGSQAGPEAVAQARSSYGLDQPILLQYATQLWRTATLQFGDSYARKQPVADLLAANVPPTVLLASLALLLAWVLALAGAVLSTVQRGRVGRVVRSVLAGVETIVSVTPHFFLGAVLILVFASALGWFPATGTGTSPAALVLPVVTLAVPLAGYLAHVMRGSLDEADDAPFTTTARARGGSEPRVLLTHTLRHAALPALALSGWAYGSLLSGAVVVEALFARPGLGRLLLEATLVRDVPVVVGAVAVIALLYVVVMLLTDLLEGIVDPRLRETHAKRAAS